MMKLKQIPEDFIVEEIYSHHIESEGSHRLYRLLKKGMETFELLDYLSRANKVPREAIGIAGVKDKHALTKQYITIPAEHEIKTMKEENFSLDFLGFQNSGIDIGDHTSNRFEIVVRDLSRQDMRDLELRAKNIAYYGLPNYFDSQRFGSVAKGSFVAKCLIQKDYEQAVKIFLTETSRWESRRVKDERKRILDSWSRLEEISVKDRGLSIVIKEYVKTGSFLDAYKKIPSQVRQMMIFAYQSYLWNECIRKLVLQTSGRKHTYPINYAMGELLFYEKKSYLPETLSTISHDAKFEGKELETVQKLLQKEGVELQDFAIKDEVGNFFSSQERATVILPKDLRIMSIDNDDLNSMRGSERFKVKLTFTLPKGSYATIIMKGLFRK